MRKLEITEKNKHLWLEWFEYSVQSEYNEAIAVRCMKNLGFTDEEIYDKERNNKIKWNDFEDILDNAIINLLTNNTITPKWKKS